MQLDLFSDFLLRQFQQVDLLVACVNTADFLCQCSVYVLRISLFGSDFGGVDSGGALSVLL